MAASRDRSAVTIEGTLLDVAWQNPHVHFFVRAKDDKGKDVTGISKRIR